MSVVYVVLLSTDDGATSVYSVCATEALAENEVQKLSSRLNDVTPPILKHTRLMNEYH